ncbi:MAG: hypothetical protein K2L75_07345, partial [Muribaculaceae bacterium]|nr:hypothetical protein [Muribaculaceae bacterium]
ARPRLRRFLGVCFLWFASLTGGSTSRGDFRCVWEGKEVWGVGAPEARCFYNLLRSCRTLTHAQHLVASRGACAVHEGAIAWGHSKSSGW